MVISAKRCKLAGSSSVGKLMVFNKKYERMVFNFHDFANLPLTGESNIVYTPQIKAFGHYWGLDIVPRVLYTLSPPAHSECVSVSLIYYHQDSIPEKLVVKGFVETTNIMTNSPLNRYDLPRFECFKKSIKKSLVDE